MAIYVMAAVLAILASLILEVKSAPGIAAEMKLTGEDHWNVANTYG